MLEVGIMDFWLGMSLFVIFMLGMIILKLTGENNTLKEANKILNSNEDEENMQRMREEVPSTGERAPRER